MTRDELRGIVEGISDEQLKKILDINSADIGKVKLGTEKMKTELDVANQKILDMEKETEFLRQGQCEAEEMKLKVEELQKVIDKRRLEDEALAKEAALEERFSAAVGNARFLNEYTRQGVFALFQEALEAEENKGMSDSEIFDSITKDAVNIFEAENDVPSVVASTLGFGGDLSRGDVREIMGLSRE